jgi:hypothetical protein
VWLSDSENAKTKTVLKEAGTRREIKDKGEEG